MEEAFSLENIAKESKVIPDPQKPRREESKNAIIRSWNR
jgi:hypothetical protein